MNKKNILYDGLYEWTGTTREGEKPICWWPGSYRIRIIDLASDEPDIFHLRPTAVICQNNSSGTSIRNYVQNFARAVSEKYNLEMEKTIWVEIAPTHPCEIQAATFKLVSDLENNRLFSVRWRDLRPNEFSTLEPYLDDFIKKDN
ncbi:MAG: hypothetical protein R6U68_12040 [Desulfobacteraceae bacterium]